MDKSSSSPAKAGSNLSPLTRPPTEAGGRQRSRLEAGKKDHPLSNRIAVPLRCPSFPIQNHPCPIHLKAKPARKIIPSRKDHRFSNRIAVALGVLITNSKSLSPIHRKAFD
jgi:hypothetical protein